MSDSIDTMFAYRASRLRSSERRADEWTTTTTTGRPSRPAAGRRVGRGLDDADLEWAEYVAWADREAAAGRDPEPEPWVVDEREPWDPEPDDPESRPGACRRAPADPGRPLFAEDGAADVMPPVPFLAALTEQAVADVAGLSDNELVGVLRATQRQIAREQYKQVLAAAEFGRRRQAAFEDALARGVPGGLRAGRVPRRGAGHRAGRSPGPRPGT